LKFDKIDAYKNVPAKIQDLNYQGFMWGGRYFMEPGKCLALKPGTSWNQANVWL
jgi:hypothetical protein